MEFRQNEAGIHVPWVEHAGEKIRAVWSPQPGSQRAFLACPEQEVLFEGPRANGKTIGLLMDFAQFCGVGYGPAWKGVIFRHSQPQHREVISLFQIIKEIWPEATFNRMTSIWEWPTGECLQAGHLDVPEQFADYIGKSFTWIGFEELTTWKNDLCFKPMLTCLRSPRANIPKHVRSTTNPSGPGQGWVLERYRLPLAPGLTVGPLINDAKDEYGNIEPARRVIHGLLSENVLMMQNDPRYVENILGGARSISEYQAWAFGSWTAPSGGILSEWWGEYKDFVVVPHFMVPPSGRMFRSLDWGQGKPSSIGFWWVSDGSDILFQDGTTRSTLRGDLYRVGEVYTAKPGKPNVGTHEGATDITRRCKDYELRRGWRVDQKTRVLPGPADTQIFDIYNDACVAADFEKLRYRWEEADKGPNSRMQGLDQLVKRIKATRPIDGVREEKGIFIMDCCHDWLRTVPTLPRDPRNPDDADTDAEDHAYDETRYALRFEVGPGFTSGRVEFGSHPRLRGNPMR